MSFNKSIDFPAPPSGFKVTYIGNPDITVEESNSASQESYNRGKQEATSFYQAEIKKLTGRDCSSAKSATRRN